MTLLGFWPGLIGHGAIWGLWHAPLILLLGCDYPGHPLLRVPLFVVTATLLGIAAFWHSGALSRAVRVPAEGAPPLTLRKPGA